MLHPSYTDLMQVVNKDVEPGEEPVVNSRYSIVMATAKRARQIIDGDDPLAVAKCQKPFSIAVEELYEGKVKVIGDGEEDLEFDDEVVTDEVSEEAEVEE
ncbi:MAG: DNA-directed RNA polymerase subunit omega [Eubacterium sp.]|nr:DNA-directed RNA polymerase subunit omega [Eubacterium sp.]